MRKIQLMLLLGIIFLSFILFSRLNHNDLVVIKNIKNNTVDTQISELKIPVFKEKNITNYQHIIKSPIFHSTRKPGQTSNIAVTPVADFIVTGVVISPEQKFAWIKNSKGQQIKVSQGEIINRWFLEKIQKEGVFLRYGKHTLFVKLTQ
jgi:type II secretory pathway component PulC